MSALRITACICVGIVLTACATLAKASDEPIVVLDSWRSHDFAKVRCSDAIGFFKSEHSRINQFGCASVNSCPKLKPAFDACASDPIGGVIDFEDRLATQLAMDPTCKGVQFLRYADPKSIPDNALKNAMESSHWTMTIEYLPGAQKQPWSLQAYESKALLIGDGNPKQIAAQVCFILNDRGVRRKPPKKNQTLKLD